MDSTIAILNIRPKPAMKVDFDISEVITAWIHGDLGDFKSGWVWKRKSVIH